MTDPLLLEAASGVFADVCSHQDLQAAEREGWAPRAWAAVAEMGLPWISVPEERAGQGGTLEDAAAVLQLAGRHALPLPLAETGMIGGWLLASAGLDVPAAAITVAPGRAEDDVRCDGRRLTGVANRVPWARAVDHVVLLVSVEGRPSVAVLRRDQVQVEERSNVAGEPRDTVRMDGVTPEQLVPAGPGVDPPALRMRGALTRVCLAAGALERVRDITVQYTGDREQFGRPLARFQAVQQHLTHVVQQAAIVVAAAQVAAREMARGAGVVEVAAAKVLTDHAAEVATRAAHQAHGAMGMTQEYALHHVTRRLWSWRREYGDGIWWSEWLGRVAVDQGADRLAALVTGGTAALADSVAGPQ